MSSTNLQFSIAGHKLRVVAIDGFYIVEQEVDYISGERYDFILVADQEPNSYQMLAIEHRSAPNIAILNETNFLNSIYNATGPVDTTRRECSEDSRCKEINCPYGISN